MALDSCVCACVCTLCICVHVCTLVLAHGSHTLTSGIFLRCLLFLVLWESLTEPSAAPAGKPQGSSVFLGKAGAPWLLEGSGDEAPYQLSHPPAPGFLSFMINFSASHFWPLWFLCSLEACQEITARTKEAVHYLENRRKEEKPRPKENAVWPVISGELKNVSH